MLLSWDACVPSPNKPSTSDPATPRETPELRELRLRQLYQQALHSHRNQSNQLAKRQFEQLASEFRQPQQHHATARQSAVGEKRPRDSTPLWERRLRFAVNRNLAEVCYDMHMYAEAVESYALALDDDRSDFLVWVRAARAATLCGRLHVARRAFETALRLRPDHWLCRDGYRAVLAAIGDADEDVVGGGQAPVGGQVELIVRERYRFLEIEREGRMAKQVKAAEVVSLEELTWACLVDALRVCLERRVSCTDAEHEALPVGHPVRLQYVHARTAATAAQGGDRNSIAVMVLSDDMERSSEESPADDDSDVVEMPATTGSNGVTADEEMPDVRNANGPEISSPSGGDADGDAKSAGDGSDVADQDLQGGEKVSPHVEKFVGESDMQVDSGVDKGIVNQREATEKAMVIKTEPELEKRQEVRRSSRQRQQANMAYINEHQRKTRTATESTGTCEEDRELIQSLLEMCLEGSGTSIGAANSISAQKDAQMADKLSPEQGAKRQGKKQSCSWVKTVDERNEASAVSECISSFAGENSGPPDLLLRALESLSKLKVTQYSPTIALLWSTLRANLQLHMPDSSPITLMIVEALLVSGKKAGKAKARRFQEASRLLSHVRISAADEEETNFLRVRTAWLWSQLHECLEEMQRAFVAAEQTLALLLNIQGWAQRVVPETLGPELSGYTFEELVDILQRRIAGLRMARDLEKAKEELSKITEGDTDAAKRTVSILSPSVHESIRRLRLDSWSGDDLRMEFADQTEQEVWDRKLDAETQLEPQLAVFGEACAKSADSVGELVCFSVRLRMAVHYYAAQIRTEIDSGGPQLQHDSDSSSARLTDLLVQIRKYVLIIKKLSHPSSSQLWNDEKGVSGWSMEKAATIASITLVSLISLVITKIPLLKYSPANTELGASQKNKRLAFTRCILAYARCNLLICQCRRNSASPAKGILGGEQNDPAMTTKMLRVISLCLKTLVARGCCREEGTSGALIKLYVKYLCNRLRQLAFEREISIENCNSGRKAPPESDPEANSALDESSHSSKQLTSESNSEQKPLDPGEGWEGVAFIRNELVQCFQCLYQVQELDSSGRGGSVFNDEDRWLEDGCRVSRHIGLSYSSGDPSGGIAAMDTDVCNSVFLFYRRYIFEAICLRRRDGGRAKRLRDVLSRLAENLPDDVPGFRMLPFQVLDTIVTDVLKKTGGISREAAESVSRLEDAWNSCSVQGAGQIGSVDGQARNAQLATTFFEVFALQAMSTFSAHDAEYKKHKTAERRKRPKEVADRLFSASGDCLVALRCRPWSVGAWILLGRIFVEIADLALDERELSLSSFGLYRSDELVTLGDGDAVETVFGRAEACFGFAASLLHHSWATKASTTQLDSHWSEILGLSYNGEKDSITLGIGDDGDLFGPLGLSNATTSRAILRGESHPTIGRTDDDHRRIAAIRFGEAALTMLRLRELRYFHLHWTQDTTQYRISLHPRNQFSAHILALGDKALTTLREGTSALSKWNNAPRNSNGEHESTANVIDLISSPRESGDSQQGKEDIVQPEWRIGYVGVERLQWYFSMMEGVLMRKCGKSPEEYMSVFQRAIDENRRLRAELRQAPDIEPLYKLHASRMKLLRMLKNDRSSFDSLSLLEKYSFTDTWGRDVHAEIGDGCDKELEDFVTDRKIAIAEDILVAMQFCRDPKSGVQYAEYYYKATYCRALILHDVLKDTRVALEELGTLFKTDAAAKVLDQGPDGVHRGYFYKIWNYRITDTGIEPTLESERKLVRWRSKILGLYIDLLRRSGEWRLLAAIIYRLKKRSSEDLPVDGALLDDLILAYAMTSRAAILNSLTKGILTNAAVFESSFRRTWDIYVETLRLAQGIKRVRVSLNRDETNETGGERLVRSGRPRCLLAIHTALRLEYVRWRSAQNECEADVEKLRAMPVEGKMKETEQARRREYVETLRVAVAKWPLDDKMTKLLNRRISDYSGPGSHA
eukprot:GFKZ01008128.1.p1 GENE.GFKZ01008128.1~~GFKZ01008128.1.p1  ORF type:complete len:1966 (+),score=267.57 GFKZ01008128.1:160-6057(+)